VGQPGNRLTNISGGIADYPECKTENELFMKADAMLHQAKQGGHNQVSAL
jgi:PleD family two-component response regulator